MKKTHIIILVFIAATIAILIIYTGDISTYQTIASAKERPGKTVSIIAMLDTNSIIYNPITNPNYLSFVVKDTTGQSVKVVYYYEKPFDMEKSDRIVLKGKMENGIFEIKNKDGILIKCPSKYKDDMQIAKKNLQYTTSNNSSPSAN